MNTKVEEMTAKEQGLPEGIAWRCKVGIHKYSVWGSKFTIPGASYAFEFQQRTCLRCGRINERIVS